jgi:predicted alpha/beta-fold hydrolase
MTIQAQTESVSVNIAPFDPHPWLRNRHVMTIVTNFWPRRFPHLDCVPTQSWLFDVGEDSKILAQCHWQKNRSSCDTVLIIQAHDDPFVPVSCVRQPPVENNPFIRVVVTKHGGHVGFVESRNGLLKDEDRFWAENRAVEFCRQILESRRPQ